MIRAHLGETIDIHGGGSTSSSPPRERDRAEPLRARRSAAGAILGPQRLRRHGRREDVEEPGNIITPAELLAQGHRGETLRLALLSDALPAAAAVDGEPDRQSKATLDRLYRSAADEAGEVDGQVVDALRDDLNTPLGAVAPFRP
jgi:cysteinyl-tRNA synthetase